MLNAEVMPSEGPMDKVDFFLPLPLDADAEKRRGDENYNILVRLKPGVSVPQAQADQPPQSLAPAWLCVFLVVRVVRTEQNQPARAPDHQHDEYETEEQIDLRLLKFGRYRGEPQANRRQDRQRMPIPGLRVESIQQVDGDAHRQQINQDSQHAEHAEPPNRYCRPKNEMWASYSIQPPPSTISPS